MNYTIEQLKNGECCLLYNKEIDDTDDLNLVLQRAFPDYKRVASGTSKYYQRCSILTNTWVGDPCPDFPSQALKDFLNEPLTQTYEIF